MLLGARLLYYSFHSLYFNQENNQLENSFAIICNMLNYSVTSILCGDQCNVRMPHFLRDVFKTLSQSRYLITVFLRCNTSDKPVTLTFTADGCRVGDSIYDD